MAKRGKRPEDHGQLSLFEENEPEWLKPVNQLGYTIASPEDGKDADADLIPDRQRSGPVRLPAQDDDSDDLVQFAEWLAGKRGD